MLFHEITKDAVQRGHRARRRDRRAEGGRAAGASHARPARRLQGEPHSLEERQEGALGGARPDGRAPAHRRARARDPRVQAAGVLDASRRCSPRTGSRSGREARTRSTARSRRSNRAEAAQRVVDAVRARKPFDVTEVRSRERRKNPAAPFTTSTLQQEAAKKLGFGSKRTMRAAQDLYEGIEVGEEGAVGLITYMRTDSTRVAETAATRRATSSRTLSARRISRSAATLRHAEERPNPGRARSHPSDRVRPPAGAGAAVPRARQFKLYQLIWQRFMASQMTPAVFDTTTVDFDLGRTICSARTGIGASSSSTGFHALYTEAREKEEGKTIDDLQPLPPLEVGERVEVREITPSQHFTEPPPRFSEASLVKELERLGIGRPSTYASIISTLVDRRVREARAAPVLPDRARREGREGDGGASSPTIFNVGFTSEMEEELDKIEEGELGWRACSRTSTGRSTRRSTRWTSNALVAEAHDLSPRAGDGALSQVRSASRAARRSSGRTSPARTTRRRASTRSRSRRTGHPTGRTDEKCHECGSPMVIRTGRFGEFLGLHHVPEVQGTRSMPPGMKCPKDGGDLAERRNKRGKAFWGCVRYPGVRLLAWNKPVPETCPECGWVGHGEEDQQGARRDAGPASSAAKDWPSPSPRRWRWREGHRRRRRPRRLGGRLGARGARRQVTLHEMRPVVPTPAHQTDRLAELVCSNSFKSVELTNAHGLLKAEMRALGSLLLPCADRRGCPAAPRWRWIASCSPRRSTARHRRIRASRVVREEVAEFPSPGSRRDRVRSPPMPGRGHRRPARHRGAGVLRCDRADRRRRFARSRALYRAVALRQGETATTTSTRRSTRAGTRHSSMRSSRRISITGTSSTRCRTSRDACRSRRWRARGRETLRFGPMKPVGLPDPRTGREPHAVVQLRREDRAGQMWNLVGFQTRLRIPEQQRVFRMIPGLESAEFLRYGSIHRNSYVNSPATLGAALTARDDDRAVLRGADHRCRGVHRVARRPDCWRGSTSRDGSRARSAGAAADHDAGRALPLSARRRSGAFPADERELRPARSARRARSRRTGRSSCWSSGRRRISALLRGARDGGMAIR